MRSSLIRAFKQYLLKSLGLKVEPRAWKSPGSAPIFFRELYVFYSISIVGKTCLLAVLKETESLTPAAIYKQLSYMQEITGLPCIYLASAIFPHNRQRLLTHGVQFVIPGRQIHLPKMGIDWTERRIRGQMSPATLNKQLSPSAQAIIIYAMVHRQWNFISLELAQRLHYAPMTMTRALNELESLGIGQVAREGRERRLRFVEDSFEIWKQALPFLRTPVKKRFWVKLSQQGFGQIKQEKALAGESALSERSMLSGPDYPIYAVNLQKWQSLQQPRYLHILPNAEEADAEIEVWSYDPFLFAKNGMVDPFSLHLSLREIGDERIEIALEEMWRRGKE